jgi:hypothetical protein
MALQVIGSGMGRTGTLTLKAALETLGFGPCHHMLEVMEHPESMALWVEAGKGRPDWDAIYGGYAATVDFPGSIFWRELADFYPEAKVLHSTRDPDKWFESTQETIFSVNSPALHAEGLAKEFFGVLVNRFSDRLHDRAFMIDQFRRHDAAVAAAIPADRLLVFEASQGWDPLCAFLGVPVAETPFPMNNTREDFKAGIGHLRSQAGLATPA